MSKEQPVETLEPVIPMPRSDLLKLLALGAAAGLLIWLLGMVLHRFVFDVYFCQGETGAQCGSAKNYAVAAASLIGGVAALVGLIRFRVYRPLLVLAASLISTWGLAQIGFDLAWYAGLIIMAVLYALAFGVYGWIARVREFWIALVVMVLLVVATRLALMS